MCDSKKKKKTYQSTTVHKAIIRPLLGLRRLFETVLLQLDFTALLRERTRMATPRRKAIANGIPTNVVA